MPSLSLHIDKALAETKLDSTTQVRLRDNLQAAVLNHLKPAPETFQCDIIVCETCGPTYPVSMTLQFRATEARSEPVVMACLADIAQAIEANLGSGARLRAFAIDQTGLFALDHKPS